MVWTSNIPQATQTIAGSQPQLQANTNFLQTGLAVEHVFNAVGDGSDMRHTQVSMANQAAPVLPAGTNGMYFVSGGLPKYTNATNEYFLQFGLVKQTIFSVDLALNSGSAIGITFAARSAGTFYLIPPDVTGGPPVAVNPSDQTAVGFFVTNATGLYISPNSSFNPGIDVVNAGGRSITFKPTSSSRNGTYTLLVVYATP